jgi:hypothetical protein
MRSHTARTISKRECAMAVCSTIWNGTTKRPGTPRRDRRARQRVASLPGGVIPRTRGGSPRRSRCVPCRVPCAHPCSIRMRSRRGSRLSQIARRTGDRAAAQRELQFIASLPDDERRREIPGGCTTTFGNCVRRGGRPGAAYVSATEADVYQPDRRSARATCW